MPASRVHSPAEAVARVGASDSLAIGLGPAHPIKFLHAMGERDDWVDLNMFGALLTDLYTIFTKPGVHYRSGFFGPAERFLRDSGADISYVPADFRRFGPVVEALAPHVMATAAAPPDADGYLSLSLHAGATVDELHRCGADPERHPDRRGHAKSFPRTFGVEPDHPHRLHIDEVDILVESDAEPVDLAESPGTDIDLAIAEDARRYIPDGATLQTGIGGDPVDHRRPARRRAGRRVRRPLRDVHHRTHAAARGGQGHQHQQGSVRRVLRHDVRGGHTPSSTSGSTATPPCGSCRSTS